MPCAACARSIGTHTHTRAMWVTYTHSLYLLLLCMMKYWVRTNGNLTCGKKKGKINCRAASDKQKIKIKMASGDAFAAKVPRHLNQKDASLLFGNGVASRKGGSRHMTVLFTKPFGDLVEERTGWASTLCHYGILVTPPNSSNKQKKNTNAHSFL